MPRAAMTAESAQTIGRNITESMQTRFDAGSTVAGTIHHLVKTYGDTMMIAWMQDMAAAALAALSSPTTKELVIR